MRMILNTIIMLLLALPCCAFEPEKHEEFSKQAALVYKKCTGRTISKELISAFAEGSADEDDPGLTRAMNWHFYNRDKKIGHYWKFILYCDGSNEHIYHERLKELENMIIAKKSLPDIYAVAGRIAHHIQDMSSPPHVVPIYHMGCDKFDKYKFDRYKSFPISDEDEDQICKDVNDNEFELSAILNMTAKKTLKEIERPVVFDNGKTIEGETWMNFWGGPEDQKLAGFKTYGKYGNVFGGKKPCRGESCGAFYNGNVYDRFYNECYKRAVSDTVHLIMYLDKIIKD